jgi:hypothetical protein
MYTTTHTATQPLRVVIRGVIYFAAQHLSWQHCCRQPQAAIPCKKLIFLHFCLFSTDNLAAFKCLFRLRFAGCNGGDGCCRSANQQPGAQLPPPSNAKGNSMQALWGPQQC